MTARVRQRCRHQARRVHRRLAAQTAPARCCCACRRRPRALCAAAAAAALAPGDSCACRTWAAQGVRVEGASRRWVHAQVGQGPTGRWMEEIRSSRLDN
eukprot:360830-Chlamydomonas_euryale.AAC.4